MFCFIEDEVLFSFFYFHFGVLIYIYIFYYKHDVRKHFILIFTTKSIKLHQARMTANLLPILIRRDVLVNAHIEVTEIL